MAGPERLLARISGAGLQPLHMPGSERVVLGALGDERVLAELSLDSDPDVESVKPILAPYKLVSRELHPHDTIVRIGKVAIGGASLAVIAGPCAVETPDQLPFSHSKTFRTHFRTRRICASCGKVTDAKVSLSTVGGAPPARMWRKCATFWT
ncbi:MAG: hypothetical protein LC648_00285 [Novosphingobium sp.]|nr:hypothetical protein [Novosphingobium sp.]